MNVELSVSIGEALDKYSILEIKKEKIQNDEKLKHVQKEMDVIYPKIKDTLNDFEFHYKRLLEVNKEIWEDQDIFRDDKGLNETQKSELCMKIIKDNDRRFRIKSKINDLSNSMLKEQKGYNPRKAFVFHHLGMGDMITMCGAIRYLSTTYDEVVVVCKKQYAKSVELMYKDDKTIKFHIVNRTEDLKPTETRLKPFKNQGYDIFLSGSSIVPNLNRNVNPFYVKFYKDMNLPYEYRFKYAHISRDKNREEELYKSLVKHSQSYIFVHDKPNQRLLLNYKNSNPDKLVFNVNINYYDPKHKWHGTGKIASSVEPIFNFGKIMENAEEIHVLDSSFFCYAQYLDLSKVKKLNVHLRQFYDLKQYFHPNQNWEIKKM